MSVPTDGLGQVLGFAALSAVAAWVCGARPVHVVWAALLVTACGLVGQQVSSDVGSPGELRVAVRPDGAWSPGHAAWLLSPNVFDPLPERTAVADPRTGIATLPAAVALDHRGHRPVSGTVPWLGWTALWLALVGLAAPGGTSGTWVVRVLLVATVVVGGFEDIAPHAQAVAVALLAALAARGLAWLDARADEALGAGVPMAVAALSVAAGGATIAAATWLGVSTDARAVEWLLAQIEDGDVVRRDPGLVAACAAQVRRVVDVAAGVGAVSMGALLWHLKSRGAASRVVLMAVSLVELVGAVYVFRSL